MNHTWPHSFTLIAFLRENELLRRGWGVFFTLVEIPEGLGGGDIGFLWKWKIQEGGGGPKWNSLFGGGLDIFWNYTIENSLCYMDFSKKLSRILPTPLMFK